MPSIFITAVDADRTLEYDIPLDLTIGTLKEFCAADLNMPLPLKLSHNDSLLTDDDATLENAGLMDKSHVTVPSIHHNESNALPARAQGVSEDAIEQLRQQLLSNPGALPELQRSMNNQLSAENLRDPQRFRELFQSLERSSRQAESERARAIQQLNAGSSDSQARIAELLRQQRIQTKMEEVHRDFPEFFGRVTMLYVNVEVNGYPVKAFVDSGAQVTILSTSCAERCNVGRDIDTRWGGVARGVGTAKILGKIWQADVRIGDAELPCSFTVMDSKVDMLFGLDMLKRYQLCIDLNKNRLVFQHGASVPFLPENEIPKDETEYENEQLEQGPNGSSIGASTGAIHSGHEPGVPAGANPSSAIPSSSGNFRGTGRSLESSSNQSQSRPPPPPPPTPAAVSFPQEAIDTLVGMGASREEAIAALRASQGNVDMAASIILGF